VQTNSYPSHCINSDVVVKNNDIDFEVYFNPTYTDFVPVSLTTSSAVNNQLCTWNKPTTLPPRGINKIKGVYNGIVGVAITGAPIYAGISESAMDPWYPSSGSSLKWSVDECLGDANSAN
jgi:hypothetical protein